MDQTVASSVITDEDLAEEVHFVRESTKEQIIKLITDMPAISGQALIQKIRDL